MALNYPNFSRGTTPTTRLPGGYQTGDPLAIARRYSRNPVTMQSNLNNVAWSSRAPAPSITPAPPLTPAPRLPPVGAAGPTGDPGMSSYRSVQGGDLTQPETSGIAPPQGNATQRWKEAGGSQHSLNRANAERGVRPAIDARATQAPGNARTDFHETFGPGRSHMGGYGATWEQRQASNRFGEAAAADQRGLSQLPY